MANLKPCPFCGAKNREGESPVLRVVKSIFDWSARCLVCGACGPERSGPTRAEAAWNERAEETSQPLEDESVMVNTPYDVFILPLQPSGLTRGPRFVVHAPGPEHHEPKLEKKK